MPPADLTTFARRLRELRQAAGLSLAQLGERVGLAKAYLWQMETGRRPAPSWDTVVRLADALGVSVEEFRRGATGPR